MMIRLVAVLAAATALEPIQRRTLLKGVPAAAANIPAGHCMHAALPGSDVLPTPHGRQALAFFASANCPPGQSEHAMRPVTFANVPLKHATHNVAPSSSWE